MKTLAELQLMGISQQMDDFSLIFCTDGTCWEWNNTVTHTENGDTLFYVNVLDGVIGE